VAGRIRSGIIDKIIRTKTLYLKNVLKVWGVVKMKYKIVLGICLMFFGFIYCQKENSHNYKSIGTITGQDYRMCPSPCCGEWSIKIDSLTYEFDSLPSNSSINLEKETFPLVVKLDWQLSNTIECPNKRITIQKIAKE
jgi:hypothetical protein